MFHFKQQLAKVQHGFVKGRSVETNLSSFLNYAAPNVFAGGQVDVIYFDMSKAFDKVDHHPSLTNLSRYGISTNLCKCLFFIILKILYHHAPKFIILFCANGLKNTFLTVEIPCE